MVRPNIETTQLSPLRDVATIVSGEECYVIYFLLSNFPKKSADIKLIWPCPPHGYIFGPLNLILDDITSHDDCLLSQNPYGPHMSLDLLRMVVAELWAG